MGERRQVLLRSHPGPNLFSGISLSIERPFQLGDQILLESGVEGEVIELNWRATHVTDQRGVPGDVHSSHFRHFAGMERRTTQTDSYSATGTRESPQPFDGRVPTPPCRF
jgi:mechanosensitive ion channel-like protein